MPYGMSYQRSGNALPLMAVGNLGIEKEGIAAVRHIDEPDQVLPAGQASGHPAQAVWPDLIPQPATGRPPCA